jgi:hypothetical protein
MHALDISVQLDRSPGQKRQIVSVQNRMNQWRAFGSCDNGRPTVTELRSCIWNASDRNTEGALAAWEDAAMPPGAATGQGAGDSDDVAEFRDWYRKRYGVDFGSEGNIRLVPMDLRETWRAARGQTGDLRQPELAQPDVLLLGPR